MRKKLLLTSTAVMLFSLSLLVGCTQSAKTPNAPTATPSKTEATSPTATPTPTMAPEETLAPTPTEIPHEHEYIASESVPASCETDGETLYTCTCGDSYTEPIAAIGQDTTILQMKKQNLPQPVPKTGNN